MLFVFYLVTFLSPFCENAMDHVKKTSQFSIIYSNVELHEGEQQLTIREEKNGGSNSVPLFCVVLGWAGSTNSFTEELIGRSETG